jgi:hypothetical protein
MRAIDERGRAVACALIAASVACGLAACADSTAPSAFQGHFVATAIDGRALPADYEIAGVGSATVTAGYIDLAADRSYEAHFTYVATVSGVQWPPADYADAGTYTTAGDSITVRSASQGATGGGRLEGSTLNIYITIKVADFEGDRHRFTFRKT